MNSGLKIRLLTLLLGVCCIITAISLRTSISNKDLLLHEATEFQSRLATKERIVKSYLSDPVHLDQLKKFSVDDELASGFIAKYRAAGINVLVYKDNFLEFWSSYRALPNNVHKLREGPSFHKLSNGYYELIKKTQGNYVFLFMIIVKTQFTIENQYLKNEISPIIFDRGTLDIANFGDKETTDIFNIDNEFLFTVKLSADHGDNFYVKWQLWLWIAGILLVCVFINAIALWLANKGKVVLGTLLVTVFVFLIRWSDLHYFWFSHQFNLRLFDPSLYAESDLLPSLGDLLLNVFAVSWITIFAFAHRYDYKFSKYFSKKRWQNYLALVVITIMLGAVAMFVDDLFFGLVYYSKIDFNISNIINLGWFSWLSIYILCLVWLNIFLLINIIIALVRDFVITLNEKYLYFFIVVACYTIYEIATDYTIFYLVYCLLVFATAYNSIYRRISISLMAIVFLCMATISSIKYVRFETAKERNTRMSMVNKLTAEVDPKVINTIELLERGLRVDSQVVKFFRNPHLSQTFSFHNYIIKSYLDGYLSKFEYKINEYNTNNESLKPGESLSIERYKDLVKYGANKTSQTSYFYKVNDTFGYQNYFGIIPIYDNGIRIGLLAIELRSRPYDYNSYFPDLLIDGRLKSDENLNKYSLAFYKDRQLFSQSGKYGYPMENTIFEGREDKVNFSSDFSKDTPYSHAVFKPSKNKLVVVSIEKVGFTVRLATLSFFFLIFVTFGAVSYGIWWIAVNLSDGRGGIFNLNRYLLINANKILYRTRIQFSIVLSVVATLIIVGWTTFFNIRQQYQSQQREQIREKLRKVQLAYEKQPSLVEGIDKNADTQSEFNQFSDYNGVYLTVFDLNGNLQLTSIPRLYESGILSKKMSPRAYINLAMQKHSEYVNPMEKIGEFNYAVGYAPIKNRDNQTVAYMSIPYFSSEQDYQSKIGTFLNTLINIYALVFVLIGVLSVFLANQITGPLAFIQDNIRRTKFGQTNQPIIWHRQDEIGALIKEYNKMIAELEVSATKLARSERESAWREMAKQVAHEIKNPLTPLKLGVQLLEKAWKEKDINFEKKFALFNKSFVEQIDSLATIASEFSNFAKMPDTKLENIELVPIIEQANEVFSSSDNVTIQITNITNRTIVVLGDRDQLLRTFNNLLKNAIEAGNDHQQCVIRIHISNDEQNAFVEVEDNGRGIPVELAESIFRPNFTTKSSGTGLGLAFVKQAIENAGGRVNFKSVPNVGTVFHLLFPLV